MAWILVFLSFFLGSLNAETPAVLGPNQDLSKEEQVQLLAEFDRAQSSALLAIKHRQSLEIQEIKTNQANQRIDFENRMAFQKKEHLNKHQDISSRRKMTQTFEREKIRFYSNQVSEVQEREREHLSKTLKLQGELKKKRIEFLKWSAKGKRPPQDLWPH